MTTKPRYYMIEPDCLPEICKKTLEVNQMLQLGKVKTIHEAVKKVGISRSAYYKYRNGIKPFYELANDRIVTFHMILHDETGVLSNILTLLAKNGANILTNNQSIPINGQAAVTISANTGDLAVEVETLLKQAREMPGVVKFEVLAIEA